ncbi:arrestin domain-containing protein 3-like [Megalops cyprinoides]|uniref:arrestin domain-containing protein 3-like n=1 Tax=Megalops cyprinoides TaxID=118141 RepID=UPI001864A56B|nr:arrestin domain-containing protein 3-like [Megalops cyprinoides]
MLTTVKRMKVIYDSIIEDNTFSSGDVITGRVILEVSKEAKINSLSVKAKGEAHVHWTEGSGDDERHYSANERYFKLKQFIIQSQKGDGKTSTHRIFKEVGETIPSSTQQTITKELCIPPDLQPSILNCSIMKVEYILKVYLDVPYARDPEIILPLVIFPLSATLSDPSFNLLGAQRASWERIP